MNLKWIIYITLFIIFIHFICYFFNIDLFECFEKVQLMKEKEFVDSDSNEIHNNIDTLSKSLEQLKEMNT